MLVQLGDRLGFKAYEEHSWERSHRFDVVYFDRHERRRYPIAVFEVHRAGNEYKDLAAFKNVLNSYGEAPLLFYVLVGDFERKRSQIETEIGRSFPELKDRLALISAEDVKRLYDLLESSTASQLLERLMKKLIG